MYLILFMGITLAIVLTSQMRKEPDTTLTISRRDDKTCVLHIEGRDYCRVSYAISHLIEVGDVIQRELIIPINLLSDVKAALREYRVNVVCDIDVAKSLDKWEILCNRLIEAKEQAYKIDTKLPLMDYQKEGVNYLREALLSARPFARGALLGDPVGLGKTAQAIATAHSLMPNPINKVLIICPSGLRYNWQNEINKVIGLTSSVAMKGFDEREATYKQWTKTKWLVCSYDSIKQLADIDILQPLVDDKTLMILDEAQSIKNWRPLRSKAVRRLIRGAYGCIPVSATFMENNLGELYNIVSLVSREIFGGNKKLFLSRYVDSDAEGKPTSYRNLDEVHRRLAPFLLRRKKEDVSSQIVEKIPSRTITTDYWVDLTPSQHAAYAKLIHDSITLDTGEKINVVNALQRLMLRRQVCLFPELVGLKGISAKSAAIVDVINSFEKETKLIVFTWFRESARMITQILESHGMKAIALVGDERDNVPELVKRFNEDSSIRVMVANDFMKAGHNLQVASAIINFDLLWNPMSLEQRRGRIDRIGQKSDIISVINILTKGTIEEVMWLKLQGKIGLFSEVIEGEEPRLTTRDIRAIVTKERELFEENKG